MGFFGDEGKWQKTYCQSNIQHMELPRGFDRADMFSLVTTSDVREILVRNVVSTQTVI